jgi:hypothetical protein
MADGHAQTPDFFPEARRIVEGQLAAQIAYADRYRGIAGALDHIESIRPVEGVEEVAERLAEQHRRAEAFRASPRGRFEQAVDALAEVGAYDAEVHRLRGFYDRQLTTLNGPLTAEALPAVAECIAILNGVVGRDARAGIDALTDLLREEGPALGKAA